jgi:hypothetical protein
VRNAYSSRKIVPDEGLLFTDLKTEQKKNFAVFSLSPYTCIISTLSPPLHARKRVAAYWQDMFQLLCLHVTSCNSW